MHSTWFSSTFHSLFKFLQIKEGGPTFLGGSNSPEHQNDFAPHLYFNFRNFRDPNSSSLIRFELVQYDSAALFSAFLKLIKLMRGYLISWGEPILQNGWIILSPLLYFNFSNLNDPNSLSFIRFQCLLHDSAVLFSDFWNFLKLKRADLNSCGEPILQNGWIIWSPLLYFNFRSLMDPNSLPFIRFQCILHDPVVLFSDFPNFFKLRREDLNSWREPILQNGLIIWSPLLYCNFRSLKDPNSSSFIRFQYVLHDAVLLFSGFSNFLKLKSGYLSSWGEPILQTAELFGPPFCISIFEVWRTQTLCHSLDFNAFYMIQQYFSQVFENSSS